MIITDIIIIMLAAPALPKEQELRSQWLVRPEFQPRQGIVIVMIMMIKTSPTCPYCRHDDNLTEVSSGYEFYMTTDRWSLTNDY